MTVAYEYAHLSGSTNSNRGMVAKLNDLASEGWELVSSFSADKTLGLNSVTMLIRRPLEPLPPPDAAEAGWYPDPSGRWQGRFWNGRAWTFGVMNRGDKTARRDPPTGLTPTDGLEQ